MYQQILQHWADIRSRGCVALHLHPEQLHLKVATQYHSRAHGGHRAVYQLRMRKARERQ